VIVALALLPIAFVVGTGIGYLHGLDTAERRARVARRLRW
jgi:hypothetical protein